LVLNCCLHALIAFKEGWKNLLVWGDNLLALHGLLADQ